MKKRVIALFMSALMVASLTACSSGGASSAGSTSDSASSTGSEEGATGETTQPSGSKILSVQIGPNPETIDPALNSAVDGGNMLLHAFECLLVVDQEGQLAPG